MPSNSQTSEKPKDVSANPDNPGLAATAEFPHGEQQAGQGAGIKEVEKKPKQK